MYRRVARLRHRRCGNDQPDDDSSSSSAGAGSENAECIDLMSSSSPTSLRSSSSSSSHLAVKKTNHSSSSSSSSSSSDNESDEDDNRFSAGIESNDEDYVKNEELDRTIKLLQHLSGDKLQQVQQFIGSLNSTNTAKLSLLAKFDLAPSSKDLSQQAITPSTILSSGLYYAGFDSRRQASARKDLNDRRFIAFYGAPPEALAPLFKDIREMFHEESPTCRDLFLTCNWLKCYDVMHVLEGRWGNCEDYMSPRIKRCQEMMQALRRKKMKFVDSNAIVVANVDTVSFMVQEFRKDPSAKYFDSKTKSAGVKYETGVGTDEPAKQVWLRGPFPCGEQSDITIFRGGDEDTAIEDRDKNALYFQIPEKKKVAGDSAYTGEPERVICTMPEMKRKDIKWLGRLKARGETLHSRMKSFRVLGTRFRHGTGTQDKMNRHQMATESVSLIVLYDCENGRPLFEQ